MSSDIISSNLHSQRREEGTKRGTPGTCKENLPTASLLLLKCPFHTQLSGGHISISLQGTEENIRFTGGREIQPNFCRKCRHQKQPAEGGIGRDKQSRALTGLRDLGPCGLCRICSKNPQWKPETTPGPGPSVI